MASLFFSYSHKDEELRNELEKHLALLKRQGVISSWHDRRITAGADFDQKISSQLESSEIILLLISSNFLSSDYCYEKEMTRAIERHINGAAIVIPIILHPCDWKSSPFGHLKATPTDGKPVSMFSNYHEAFSIIAKDIREAATTIIKNYLPPLITEKEILSTTTNSSRTDRSSNLRIRKKFDDHDRDKFLEESYEYIADFFDKSLQELAIRNPHIDNRFKRLTATSFSAFIYDNGQRVSQCSIWYGSSMFSSMGISYSNSGEAPTNSLNESLNVVDDGYTLQLKPLGMQIFGSQRDSILTQNGAAEYYWDIFIRPLQQ
ncbi:MAG: toll/interleukin-1 receptor domain-containing protein [Chlorobiaceae bacterium]|nr:toll/interleukin-1 receptor domain-containing protein [Chlorobiaceae bacterium]